MVVVLVVLVVLVCGCGGGGGLKILFSLTAGPGKRVSR